MKQLIHRLLDSTIGVLLRLLPPARFVQLIYWLTHWYTHRRPPADALRAVFGLENMLYSRAMYYALEYGGGVIHPKHRHMRYVDYFIARIRPGDRVLDVGCGNGQVARAVAEATGAQITGIDHSPQRIAEAQALNTHHNVRYVSGDALTGLPDDAFDVILLSNVLEHIDGRVEFLRTLAARYRPRCLLIRVPRYDRDWRVPLKDELGVDYRMSWDHRIEYRPPEFEAEMAAAGLAIAEQESAWGEIWAVVRGAG